MTTTKLPAIRDDQMYMVCGVAIDAPAHNGGSGSGRCQARVSHEATCPECSRIRADEHARDEARHVYTVRRDSWTDDHAATLRYMGYRTPLEWRVVRILREKQVDGETYYATRDAAQSALDSRKSRCHHHQTSMVSHEESFCEDCGSYVCVPDN